jgi:hypothetical protein
MAKSAWDYTFIPHVLMALSITTITFSILPCVKMIGHTYNFDSENCSFVTLFCEILTDLTCSASAFAASALVAFPDIFSCNIQQTVNYIYLNKQNILWDISSNPNNSIVMLLC